MATGRTGYDISGEGNELLQEAFSVYASYLVGLAFVKQPHERSADGRIVPSAEFRSGFVLQFNRRWYWTTAGHVLADIEQKRRRQDVQLNGFRLIDHYGIGAINNDAVPFDYEGAWKHYVDDEQLGLDFGVVELRHHERSLLEANGVVPVRAKDWRRLGKFQFDAFIILGLPTDTLELGALTASGQFLVSGRAPPSGVIASRLSQAPKGSSATDYPRLIGKISQKWPEGSVDGMSGGPLLAFSAKASDHAIVGVQSCWLPKSRIVFGCPIAVFGPMVAVAIRNRACLK